MTQSATVNIKRKIQSMKEELNAKDDEIEDLRSKLKEAYEQVEVVRFS